MTERIAQFVEAVRDDPRVVGIARLRGFPEGSVELLVVSTWDGGETLPVELSRLCAPLVGGGPCIEALRRPPERESRLAAHWTGVGADGSRAEVGVRRVGDLVPSDDGCGAEPLHDPHGLVAQWIRYSEGAKPEDHFEHAHAVRPIDTILAADFALRVLGAGRPEWMAQAWDPLRAARTALSPGDPAHAALAARIDDHLRATPGPAEGARVLGGSDPAIAFESFLRFADDEGFKGDRVLFGEAVKRLRDLSQREPVFDQGFVVPTFDAVEAAFVTGDAHTGTPPLVPGVYVGVGVTPKDALEFWAAPFVRDPACTVACVDDTGDRDVVPRTAGRDPMIAVLTRSVDAAWARLPSFIERAGVAAVESVNPAAVLATLHLPKSFVERARPRGAEAPACSRLDVALALARAGHDCAPLVARKIGLAAGRVLANHSS